MPACRRLYILCGGYRGGTPRGPATHYICIKFAWVKFDAKKCKLGGNQAAKLVNAAFTSVVLHRDVNSRANVAFIIFAPDFPLVRILFASYLPERN